MGNHRLCRLSFLLLLCLLTGCGSSHTKAPASSSSVRYEAGKTRVLVPDPKGTETAGSDPLILDLSCINQGYFMGKLTEEDCKINLQVTGPDDVIYKYFLETPDVWTTFPLTAGNGPYLILAFESVGGGQYASLFSCPIDVSMENEFLPFLYPNQFVEFTSESEAVRLAASLTEEAATDLDALTAIYEYVTDHITYDNEKAASVESGYLPDIDETLRTGTGICFDYASLTAAMLRSLSIPTRLAIGYSGSLHHAWVDVYLESAGWVPQAIEFNGNEWNFMDPTFASAGKDNKTIQEYIGDGSNYTVQYIR